MTYDELLFYIDEVAMLGQKEWRALRAVVNKHKPETDMNGYDSCKECSRIAYYNVPYPCPTIDDIKKELK